VFKGKVIQLVIERLTQTLSLREGQSLIVDYQVSRIMPGALIFGGC
jgi:hypothetical protein